MQEGTSRWFEKDAQAQDAQKMPGGCEATIERMIQDQLVGRGIKDSRVLEVMFTVPRHLFVEEALRYRAYEDRPLPIGERQTISQPYMVALMTELLELTGREKVLEVGTGSGYQTAILSRLAERVYSVERIRTLSLGARRVLDELRCGNVLLRVADGTQGWPEFAPFDRILVTAAALRIPQMLIDQMCEGGIIVIPVGGEELQVLQKGVKKGEDLEVKEKSGCVFVKLIGEHGWNE